MNSSLLRVLGALTACGGLVACGNETESGRRSGDSGGGATGRGDAGAGLGGHLASGGSGGTVTTANGGTAAGGGAFSSGGTATGGAGTSANGGGTAGGGFTSSNGGAAGRSASAGGAAASGASGAGGVGSPGAGKCTPGESTTWEHRVSCDDKQTAALDAAGIGHPKAFQFAVYSDVLATPTTPSAPFTYSVAVASLDGAPVGIEVWGATAQCAGEIELLDAQILDAKTGYRGTVCATTHPTKAFTHLLLVVRSNGGFSHGDETVCPGGACQGTDGTSGAWPGKGQPFCSPRQPEQCEACLDARTCDRPTYVDNGNGTVTSSCCHLTWEKAPERDKYTYPEAQAHCSSLALAGGGWHVPTLAELLTIVRKDHSPAIDPAAFPDETGATAWSSTQYDEDPSEMACIQFSNGIVARISTDRMTDVRCVR